MSPFDLLDPQYGWLNPDQEDQTVPVPAAPGLVANAPTPGILDRLKGLFMPSQAQAAEPQGGGMDIGALLPGMILTQLGQQMQLPRNQRNPAAIPQAIMGVIKAQQGSQEEKQKLALQKLLFINELQKGKIPTSFDAAILAADAAGDKEKVERLKELKKQSLEKPERPISERYISYFDAEGREQKGLLNPDNMTVTPIGGPKKEKEAVNLHTQIIEQTTPEDPYGPPKQYLLSIDPKTGSPVNKIMIGQKGGQISPEAVDFMARIGLQDIKQLPAMGFGPQMRIPVFNRMAEISVDEGIMPEDMATRQAVRQEVKKGLGQLERQSAQLEPFIKTFDKNIEVLEEVFKSPSGVPLINQWINAGKRNLTGDPQLAKIDVGVKTVANEFARIMTSATAGSTQMPESEIKKSEALLNAAQTPEQLMAAIDMMKRDTQNRLSSFNEHRQKLTSRIEELGSYKGRQPSGENQGFLSPPTGNLNPQNMTREDLKKLTPAQLQQLRANPFFQGGR